MPGETERKATARGILDSLSDERLVLAVPHTDYRLHLVPAVGAEQIATPVGKRIRGTIEAKALRVHPAHGGGRFIEPIVGEPRIVAGTVLAIDETQRRVLVDLTVPVWMHTQNGQDYGVFALGELVNCYLQSGATFTPLAGQ